MLEALKSKISELISLYEKEKAERTALLSEIESLRIENDNYRKQITELDDEIDNLKLKEAFIAPATDNAPAKAKISKMIKDIDKCIKLLES